MMMAEFRIAAHKSRPRLGLRPYMLRLLVCLCALCALVTPSYAKSFSNVIDLLAERPYYLQFQSGFASDADFGPSLLFLLDRSEERTFHTGISIGSQVADSLFGFDVDVVVFFGLQNFIEQDFQPDSYGATAYWKVYRQWAPRWLPARLPLRFGLGQGLSYASRIPVSEQRDFEPDQSAETVHYLEWSVQFPVGGLLSLFGVQGGGVLDNTWFGYSIFHRSTVFGLFAEDGGGINYPGVALEFVLD